MNPLTCCFGRNVSSPVKRTEDTEEELDADFSSDENAKMYSYKELQAATENFSPENKIGEGGFGTVYKGRLDNGTLVAIKVLSAQSKQGARQFMNEIVAISGVEHENLVKLYGCCIEGQHRILVYGYLENNSLAQALFGRHCSAFQFTWKIRTQICIGVAHGLAFLHDEVQPRIVHRDIKPSNILLDKDFNPKISDFGLAKLFPSTATHMSTLLAGTIGYLAPEYIIRSRLTKKADVYSFGVLLLEIVSGRRHTYKGPSAGEQMLLERAWALYERGVLVQLVDAALKGDFDTVEACRYLKIGLMCTQDMPGNRPNMSVVAKMLKGEIDLEEDKISKPGLLKELMMMKDSSGVKWRIQDKFSSSQSSDTTSHATMTFSSIYDRSN